MLINISMPFTSKQWPFLFTIMFSCRLRFVRFNLIFDSELRAGLLYCDDVYGLGLPRVPVND